MSQPLPLKDQLKALEQIQEIDHKIDNLRKNKGTLPAALKALDDQIGKISASAQIKRTALAELDKTQRQTTAATELNRDRLTRSTSRLESVQNSQEFQAAQKEIDQLKKQKGQPRRAGPRSPASKVEASGKMLGELGAADRQVHRKSATAQAATLTGQSGKMEEEIASLMRDRGKYSPSVEARLLAQHDRVRGARRPASASRPRSPPAVARIATHDGASAAIQRDPARIRAALVPELPPDPVRINAPAYRGMRGSRQPPRVRVGGDVSASLRVGYARKPNAPSGGVFVKEGQRL